MRTIWQLFRASYCGIQPKISTANLPGGRMPPPPEQEHDPALHPATCSPPNQRRGWQQCCPPPQPSQALGWCNRKVSSTSPLPVPFLRLSASPTLAASRWPRRAGAPASHLPSLPARTHLPMTQRHYIRRRCTSRS